MKHSATQSPKFMKLKRRLKLMQWEAVGLLESLWQFAIINCQDGAIGKFSNEDIIASFEWKGDPDHTIAQLVECGWIDPHEEHRLVIHDWADHCPKFIKGALVRHGRSFVPCNAKSKEQPPGQPPKQTAKEGAEEGPIRTHQHNITKSNLTKPNQTQPEEQVAPSPASPNSEQVPAPSSEFSKTKKPKPDETSLGGVVLVFPVMGDKEAPEWSLHQTLVDEFQSDFPDVNVLEHFRAAHRWVKNNPEKRKTAKGMRKFLHGWIERSLNRAPGASTGTASPVLRESAVERQMRIFKNLEGARS